MAKLPKISVIRRLISQNIKLAGDILGSQAHTVAKGLWHAKEAHAVAKGLWHAKEAKVKAKEENILLPQPLGCG